MFRGSGVFGLHPSQNKTLFMCAPPILLFHSAAGEMLLGVTRPGICVLYQAFGSKGLLRDLFQSHLGFVET